jgi:hypothetical protein
MERCRSAQWAARHVDHLAGNVSRTLAGQEGDGVRDIIDLADPASWHLGGHTGLEVLERHAEPGGGRGRHVGGDEAGRHRVGGDAERAEFDGEGQDISSIQLRARFGTGGTWWCRTPSRNRRGAGGGALTGSPVLLEEAAADDHLLDRG